MLKIGQDVKVIDQCPAAEGVIVDISTWGEVLDAPWIKDVCYRIRCKEWKPEYRWISAGFVEAIEKEKHNG